MEYGPRSITTATIENGTSISSPIECSNSTMFGFIMPAAWTTAALNLEASTDGTTWVTAGLFDSAGGAVSSWAAPTAAAGYTVDIVNMLPWKFVRFRSGTAASAVNQGAARVFTVITRPVA